jgi:hypothetical protein
MRLPDTITHLGHHYARHSCWKRSRRSSNPGKAPLPSLKRRSQTHKPDITLAPRHIPSASTVSSNGNNSHAVPKFRALAARLADTAALFQAMGEAPP